LHIYPVVSSPFDLRTETIREGAVQYDIVYMVVQHFVLQYLVVQQPY